MNLSFWLVICNTAVLTLVWLVQIVIYPGLLAYNERDLAKWHPVYTRQVSIIIAPLMLTQMALYGLAVLSMPSIYSIAGAALAASAFVITFVIAIPLHKAIDQEGETFNLRKRLIGVNWYRTIAWTGSFILSVIEYGK